MKQKEMSPKPQLPPEVEAYILQRAGEILPLQSQLRELARVNGITDPDVFHAFLPEAHGTGLGGDPEALYHALGGIVM